MIFLILIPGHCICGKPDEKFKDGNEWFMYFMCRGSIGMVVTFPVFTFSLLIIEHPLVHNDIFNFAVSIFCLGKCSTQDPIGIFLKYTLTGIATIVTVHSSWCMVILASIVYLYVNSAVYWLTVWYAYTYIHHIMSSCSYDIQP